MSFNSKRFLANGRLALARENAPPMKIGEVGQAVRLVQQAVIDLGHSLPKSTKKYGTPDGIYGSETKSAVWAFQNKHKDKLKRDGVVGEMTLTVLDNLLWTLPWTPLPPIPDPATPGNFDDPEANSRQVILETLASGHMARMNLSLRHEPFRGGLWSVHIAGFHYQNIGEAVYTNRIAVALDPEMGPAAFYDIDDKVIKVSRPLKGAFADKCLIVHEATHAICDGFGKPMDALFSEMVGFVAEGQYARLVQGSPKRVGNAIADKVYQRAYEIADMISKGKIPKTSEWDNFGLAIRNDETYEKFTYGTVSFGGIPK